MEHKQEYKALLAKNSSDNNLLVFKLLQSQEKWSKEKALLWIFQELIPSFETLQQERLFYFGNTGLSFIFHHTVLKEPTSMDQFSASTERLHKAVLICRFQNKKESKVLYKIDYIEDRIALLEKYKQYLLEHLEQIVCNFVAEMD